MQFIADFHIHSAFSQGSHHDLHVESIALWAKRKGIHLVGTGDWTHPSWCSELRTKLIPAEDGLFQLRSDIEQQVHRLLPSSLHSQPLRFVLSAEVSTVFEQNQRVHKLHHLLFAPDFARVQRIRQQLERYGELTVDGRPTLSLSARNLLEIVLQTSPRTHLIPAHVWNPNNGLFGSDYGFDSLEEGYGDLHSHIFALETGLSSIPSMIRQCSRLDHLALVSFSNAHTPEHLGREATIFTGELSYDAIFTTLRSSAAALASNQAPLIQTIECYPERGRYFLDGHRSCEVRYTPEESRAHQMRCPVCRKPLTIGVLHRIQQMSDRSFQEAREKTQGQFTQLIALPEILSELLEMPMSSKRLHQQYLALLSTLGSELSILRDVPLAAIRYSQVPLLSEAIERVRSGQIHCIPGYDGEYGKSRIFRAGENKSTTLSLFAWSAPQTEPVSETSTLENPHTTSSSSGQQLDLFAQPFVFPATQPLPSETFITPESLDEQEVPVVQEHSETQESRSSTESSAQTLPTQDTFVPTVAVFSTESQTHAGMILQKQGTFRPTDLTMDPSVHPTPEAHSHHEPTRPVTERDVLSGLNTEQRAAVLHRGGSLQIMAGPGTGKTKTLLHRLAYRLVNRTIQPERAVVFTFTQEAAQQFRTDLFALLGSPAHRVWIGTFHQFCLQILQEVRAEMLSLPQEHEHTLPIPLPLPASLLGAFERLALLETLAATHQIEGSSRRLRYWMDRISWAKQNLLSPEDIAQDFVSTEQDFLWLYRSYQQYLTQHHRYDLDDLLFEAVNYLRQSHDRCHRLQLQYRMFLIDEYQELNEAQYRLLRFIVSDYADLCVAGDPDQNVYAFCGSQRQYLYRFVHDFSPVHTKAIKMALWRNYRSPEAVLEAAHVLIQKQHDPQRVQPLATHTGPLFLPISTFPHEQQEANTIAEQILDLVKTSVRSGTPHIRLSHHPVSNPSLPLFDLRATEYYRVEEWSDIAIFYRSSQQLMALEQALQQTGIPYQCTRSGSTTSHKDMQIILGLLRCAVFPSYPVPSLLFLLRDWPGISRTTQFYVAGWPQPHNLSPTDMLQQALQHSMLPLDQQNILQKIHHMLQRLHALMAQGASTYTLVSWLWNELQSNLPVDLLPPASIIRNLLALSKRMQSIPELLTYFLLEHASSTLPLDSDSISLLPMRASKGSEFRVVIIPGCEDGLLPWQETHQDPEALAEERRLFYVALTRCTQLLWLTRACSRQFFQQIQLMEPSRFLKELDGFLHHTDAKK